MIGVLALQGAVQPHLSLLGQLGLAARPVRTAEEILGSSGLVLPGGESTTQRKLLARYALCVVLDAFVRSGRPVLATCAGLVIAAERRYLEVEIERNAYGPQLYSAELTLDDGRHRLQLIRAPKITHVAPHVAVLATIGGEPVVVEQGRVLGTTGHPELTGEGFLHRRAFVPARA